MKGRKADDAGLPLESEFPFDTVTSPYTLDHPSFQGPLDLLLHLIREHRLDIFDIPMAFVTGKFIEYLEMMKQLNLDVAGEYLRMAATLAYIKSRMMLPVAAADEDEEGGDPREQLIQRLLAYQQFKDAAARMATSPQEGRDIFVRASRELYEFPVEETPLQEVNVFYLLKAYMGLQRRIKTDITREITAERVTIAQRIYELVDMIRDVRERPFTELLESATTVREIIVTFLAVLEMAKMNMVRVFQVERDGEIYVRNMIEPADFDTRRQEIQQIEYR